MKLATIGVGNAGSKVVDRMVEFESETNRNLCRHVHAINTARTDLAKPEYIPEEQRVLVGDTNQKSKGHGVGGDVEIGAEVMSADIDEIRRAFDDIEIHNVDAILVAAGLGGGTGSGGGPVVIDALQDMYDEPVYALGILPGEYEGGELSGRTVNRGNLVYAVPEGTQVRDLSVVWEQSLPDGDVKCTWTK